MWSRHIKDQLFQGRMDESFGWGPHRLSSPSDDISHGPSPIHTSFLQLPTWIREAWVQVLCGFGVAAVPLCAHTSSLANLGR